MKGLKRARGLIASVTGLSIKAYAAVLTAILTGIFTFDCLWALTRMMVERALAMSMFAAIGAGILFLLFAYREEVEMDAGREQPTWGSPQKWGNQPNARFVDVGGLNVMIQTSKGKRKGKAA